MATLSIDTNKEGEAAGKKADAFDAKQLADGTKVEFEHTNDPMLAQKIAMDHLVEDKDYYKKLATIHTEKSEAIVVTPDGKQEIIPGKEPLIKDPKKSALKDRWLKLQKALDNNKAILDLRAGEQPDEDEQDQPGAEMGPDAPGGENQPDQGQGEEQPDPAGQPAEQPGAESTGPVQDSNPPDQEQAPEGQPDPEELIAALKQEGYSDPEIAYIVHGHHSPPIDESNKAKADATTAMAMTDIENKKKMAELEHSHKQQMSDHEHKHKQRMSDLEYEGAKAEAPDPELDKQHRKRMLDLEYEVAKREAEAKMPDSSADREANKQIKALEVEEKKLQLASKKMELELEREFRKREHELKLKQMEEQLKQQSKQKNEISTEKHKHKLADAKKPPEKKPLKKSDDEEDDEQGQGSEEV